MASSMDIFKIMIIAQLFFGFSITMISHSIAEVNAESLNYLSSYEMFADKMDAQNISNKLESNMASQKNLPLIELGALVFYSGNLIVDLLLNFIFAPAEMFNLLIYGITQLFNAENTYVAVQLQAFIMALITILYTVNLIQMITNIRSRGGALP